MGDEYLLPSIAAVVVGGTLITGGRGRVEDVTKETLNSDSRDSVHSLRTVRYRWTRQAVQVVYPGISYLNL